MTSVLNFMRICGKLKAVPRTGWVKRGVAGPVESVAAHSWRAGVLAFLITDPSIDKEKCMKMALVHDLAEALVGDFTPNCPISKEEKFRLENDAMREIEESLKGIAAGVVRSCFVNPTALAGAEIRSLWHEYEAATTPEALLVKDFDKFDMIMQAEQYEAEGGPDLQEFFDSTEGKFTHPTVQGWDNDLRKARRERIAAAPSTEATGKQ